jgi:hypothetical protein
LHALSPVEARAVRALVGDRERLVQEANQALQEIEASLAYLAAMYAVRAGLPAEQVYRFEGLRDGSIALVPQEREEAPPAEPAERS